MEFRYIPPDDFSINYDPLVGLIERKEFADTTLGQKFVSSYSAFPDEKKFAVIRPPGCMRGIRTSGVWISLHDYLNHDIDIGISAGAIEQAQLGNDAVEIYWRLAENKFIQLFARDLLNVMKMAGANMVSYVSPLIDMKELRHAMEDLWSDRFMDHPAKKLAIVTNAETGETLDFNIADEMQAHGRDRVIDIALASAHLPGPAGPLPLLEVDGKKIHAGDGYFGDKGPIPFDIALREGATDILLPMNAHDKEVVNMSRGQKWLFTHYLAHHNRQAVAHHKKGLERSRMFLDQIRDTGSICDEEGRRARVMVIPLGKGEPMLSATEMRRHELENALLRGRDCGEFMLKKAAALAAAQRPKAEQRPASSNLLARLNAA